jgi:ketosteroid isomerase-like protein
MRDPRAALAGAVPRIRGALGRVAQLRPKPSTPAPATESPLAVVDRLDAALRAHNLDALVDAFHPDFHGEQPLHPGAGSVDREQLRRNWATIFANVPDVRADVLDTAVAGDTVWSEWRIYGTRRDGAALDLRSVWIFGVREGRVAWARLYREPIAADEADEGDWIDRLTRPT